MMPTLILPGTVLRSAGEWPCTSALGLLMRRYSAGRSKLPSPSKETVSVLRSLCRRNSVGQACVLVAVMGALYRGRCETPTAETRDAKAPITPSDEPHLAGGAEIVAAHF